MKSFIQKSILSMCVALGLNSPALGAPQGYQKIDLSLGYEQHAANFPFQFSSEYAMWELGRLFYTSYQNTPVSNCSIENVEAWVGPKMGRGVRSYVLSIELRNQAGEAYKVYLHSMADSYSMSHLAIPLGTRSARYFFSKLSNHPGLQMKVAFDVKSDHIQKLTISSKKDLLVNCK